MDCEFKRVTVSQLSSGGALICWELSRSFFPRGPLNFYVDFGWPGTNEWTVLNKDPIVDDCCYMDVCKRNLKFLNESYYRVRLVLPSEPGCPVYKSEPVGALGRLERKDWLRARDIVRREHLQQRKVDGTPGLLLKRKKFGVACTRCLDWDTGEIKDGDCPVCYGTGIVGGYYPAVEFYMTRQAGWQRRIAAAAPPRGTTADMTFQGWRCVLYPLIDTRDVWVQADTNDRYIIDSYAVAAEYKGLPLVAIARMSLAPGGHIVYSVPLEASGSSSSSSAGPVPCDSTKGLAPTEADFDW